MAAVIKRKTDRITDKACSLLNDQTKQFRGILDNSLCLEVTNSSQLTAVIILSTLLHLANFGSNSYLGPFIPSCLIWRINSVTDCMLTLPRCGRDNAR